MIPQPAIPLTAYLILAAVLFGIGSVGFLVRRNALVALMSIELMLNAINVTFVACNQAYPMRQDGQVAAFFIIAIAAAEAAVGLAIVLSFFRLKKTVRTDAADLLKH